MRKTSRRGTYRHAFYCVGGTAHALAVQRLVARPRCRRLYRAWPLLWLPKPCMQVTSNTRNEAMFREATIFAHQLQVVEKDLVDWQRGIDSSFNNIRNIMLSPLPRVYEEGHNGHAVPSEPEPTSAHACARRVLMLDRQGGSAAPDSLPSPSPVPVLSPQWSVVMSMWSSWSPQQQRQKNASTWRSSSPSSNGWSHIAQSRCGAHEAQATAHLS